MLFSFLIRCKITTSLITGKVELHLICLKNYFVLSDGVYLYLTALLWPILHKVNHTLYGKYTYYEYKIFGRKCIWAFICTWVSCASMHPLMHAGWDKTTTKNWNTLPSGSGTLLNPRSRPLRWMGSQKTNNWSRSLEASGSKILVKRQHLIERVLQVGKVLHLRNDKQIKSWFCLARFIKLLSQEMIMFKTGQVSLKHNNNGPQGDLTHHTTGYTLELTVGVQKLHVILAVENQASGALNGQMSI